MRAHALPPVPTAARRWAWPAGVWLVVLGVYLPSVWNGFTAWDDVPLWAENPHFAPPSWAGLGYYWIHVFVTLYQPLTCSLWAGLAWASWVPGIQPAGGAMQPGVFHVAGAALHATAAAMLWSILRRVVRDDRAAAVGALLFGLHPLAVEAVAFAGGINNPLCLALGLAGVDRYLAAVAPGGTGRRAAWPAVALVAAATLAKPTAVVLPAVAVVLEVAAYRRPPAAALRHAVPLAAAVVPCLIWTPLVQPATTVPPVPLWARPWVAADAGGFYLGKLLWPVHLGLDYGRTPAAVLTPRAARGPLATAGPPVVAVAVVTAAWLARRRHPTAAAAAAVCVLGLSPNLGLVRFEFQAVSTVADRYAYLPLAGVGLAAAAAVAGRRAAAAAGAAVLVALAVLTVVQIGYWRDSVTLFRHAVAVNPTSGRIYADLTAVLDDPADRLAAGWAAVSLDPGGAAGWNNLGSALYDQRDFPAAAAALARAHALEPDNPTFAANAAAARR